MTTKRILLHIVMCLTVIGLWAWVAADDWEQEQEQERIEHERLAEIRRFQNSIKGQALGEDSDKDYVDTTPLPIAEAEPVYIAPTQRAKNTVVKAKKRIKKTVKKN